MSERFAAAIGRKVISRASAEDLGEVSQLVVDVARRCVSDVVIGKGRKARLAGWEHVTGFGPDAVMVDDEQALRPPVDDRERAAVHGDLAMIGKRALTETGDEAGTIDDVIFDPQDGAVLAVVAGSHEYPAAELLGSGAYAVVLAATTTEPPAE